MSIFCIFVSIINWKFKLYFWNFKFFNIIKFLPIWKQVAVSGIQRARDQPAHKVLKTRKIGQNTVDEIGARDLKADLLKIRIVFKIKHFIRNLLEFQIFIRKK